MKETEKLFFLNLIKQHRNVLFERFSSKVTSSDKKVKWLEIIDSCRSNGFELVPEGKDWTYVRDHTWPNIKNYSMQKIDGNKKTGAAGGKAKKLNAVDELVLDVIGKESPVVIGIGSNLETACGSVMNADSYEVPTAVAANERYGDSLSASRDDVEPVFFQLLQPYQQSNLVDTLRDPTLSSGSGPGMVTYTSTTSTAAKGGQSALRGLTSGSGTPTERKRKPEKRIASITLSEFDQLKKRKLEIEIRETELRCENWKHQNDILRIEIENLRHQM